MSSTPPATNAVKTVKARGPDWWLMAKKFFTKGSKIASFAPSSRRLCNKMLSGIDFDTANVIVELGAGTGPVTKLLLERIKPHTQLLVIEIEPEFCARLRQRFPTANIVEGDASKLDQLLAERGVTKVDHIVSGLPLPSFPETLRRAVLGTAMKMLGGDGTFRQLTVMPWVYKRLYKRYFTEVKFKLEPLNLPPAGVYLCKGYKGDELPAGE